MHTPASADRCKRAISEGWVGSLRQQDLYGTRLSHWWSSHLTGFEQAVQLSHSICIKIHRKHAPAERQGTLIKAPQPLC